MTSSKKADFDRMWNTDNVAKRTQFRNRMKSKLDQIKITFTEENARGYWMGELKAPPPKEEYRPEFEERGPLRGPPRGRGPRRGRGPPRGRGPARRP
jgi:hypothetical protein